MDQKTHLPSKVCRMREREIRAAATKDFAPKKTCALRNSLTIVPLHARLLRSTLTSRIARPGGRTYNIVHGARALLPVAPWEGERGHCAIQVPYNLNVSYGNTSCSKMPDIAIFANQTPRRNFRPPLFKRSPLHSHTATFCTTFQTLAKKSLRQSRFRFLG